MSGSGYFNGLGAFEQTTKGTVGEMNIGAVEVEKPKKKKAEKKEEVVKDEKVMKPDSGKEVKLETGKLENSKNNVKL